MKFWTNDTIKSFAVPLLERDLDKIHQSILKKHAQKLDSEQKEKLKNLVALRSPSRHQKKAILSLSIGGNCDNTIDLDFLKDCQDNAKKWHKQPKKYDGLHILETLALLRTRLKKPEKLTLTPEIKSKLRKRAASKYHTNQYLKHLIKLNSPLKNSYCNSVTCCESVISKNGSLHSAYCKNRWCQVCCRIKTANLTNGYRPELEKIKDQYFVTLSYQNVTSDNLPQALKHYQIWWRKFYLQKMDETKPIRRLINKARKQGIDVTDLLEVFDNQKIKGIKKIECTYNSNANSIWYNTYHPHLHILINGFDNAEQMLNSWKQYCSDNDLKFDLQAQKSEKVVDDIYSELFKYMTKINSSTGKKENGKKENKIFIHALDIMFTAMKGYQVFTAFGINKIVDEDEVKPLYDDNGLDEVYIWKNNDWISKDKEKLSGYKPSKYEQGRRKYIVFDKRYQLKQKMPKKYIEKIDKTTYILTEKIDFIDNLK